MNPRGTEVEELTAQMRSELMQRILAYLEEDGYTPFDYSPEFVIELSEENTR